MSRIFIFFLFMTFFAYTVLAVTEATEEDCGSNNSVTGKDLYKIKRDLLLNEFQIRNSGIENADSIIYQTRLALVTILMGILVFLFERRRKNSNENPPISIWVVLSLIVLILFMYWSDCYIKDLQDRAEVRAAYVADILCALPSMSSDQIDTVQVYPSLQESNFPHKVSLLFKPNFARILAYTPLGLMLLFLFIQAFRRK